MMKKVNVFPQSDYEIPWSDVVMLDTKESEAELRGLFKALVAVI